MTKKLNKIVPVEKFLSALVLAGFEHDIGKFETAAITLARILKNTNPEASKRINEIISLHSMGRSALRSAGASPLPINQDNQLEMATMVPPNKDHTIMPILDSSLNEKVEHFLDEREKVEILLSKNIKPTSKLLFVGPPGTGKTMLARYIAGSLNKNLIVLDLAITISSFLGKTGHNLKKVIQYARQTSSVLLLDEFDAIAKRRDDPTDLGELKRVVNILLMELEEWPVSSVLIATSNNPELLDRAIWRRFDQIFELNLPNEEQRIKIIRKELSEYVVNEDFLLIIADVLKNFSPSDICRFSEGVKRRIILKKESPFEAILKELQFNSIDKKIKGKICQIAKKVLGRSITIRELAGMMQLSPAGVQYHISKTKI